jgi:hypothetical protein
MTTVKEVLAYLGALKKDASRDQETAGKLSSRLSAKKRVEFIERIIKDIKA